MLCEHLPHPAAQLFIKDELKGNLQGITRYMYSGFNPFLSGFGIPADKVADTRKRMIEYITRLTEELRQILARADQDGSGMTSHWQQRLECREYELRRFMQLVANGESESLQRVGLPPAIETVFRVHTHRLVYVIESLGKN